MNDFTFYKVVTRKGQPAEITVTERREAESIEVFYSIAVEPGAGTHAPIPDAVSVRYRRVYGEFRVEINWAGCGTRSITTGEVFQIVLDNALRAGRLLECDGLACTPLIEQWEVRR